MVDYQLSQKFVNKLKIDITTMLLVIISLITISAFIIVALIGLQSDIANDITLFIIVMAVFMTPPLMVLILSSKAESFIRKYSYFTINILSLSLPFLMGALLSFYMIDAINTELILILCGLNIVFIMLNFIVAMRSAYNEKNNTAAYFIACVIFSFFGILAILSQLGIMGGDIRMGLFPILSYLSSLYISGAAGAFFLPRLYCIKKFDITGYTYDE